MVQQLAGTLWYLGPEIGSIGAAVAMIVIGLAAIEFVRDNP